MPSSKPRKLDPCLVCGGKSIGFNFGVLTCMACKAFFRRNAVKLGTYEFACPKDGDCPITHQYRRLCNCCRLAKCFRVGMQRALILTEGEKEARRQIIAQNRQKKLEKSLTTIEPFSLLATQHKRSSRLSPADRDLLTNIANAYESTCLKVKDTDDQELSITPHSSVNRFAEEYSNTHLSLIEYLTRIPHFHTLTMDNKLALLRNQIGIISHVNVPIVHRSISNNLIMSLRNIFGGPLANRLLHCLERMLQFSYEPLLLKLLLIILTFSSGNCRQQSDQNMNSICMETISIFTAQNVYVELLWKYLLFRLSTEFNVIRLWNKLIHTLLYVQDVHLLVDEYVTDLPHEIEHIKTLLRSI